MNTESLFRNNPLGIIYQDAEGKGEKGFVKYAIRFGTPTMAIARRRFYAFIFVKRIW